MVTTKTPAKVTRKKKTPRERNAIPESIRDVCSCPRCGRLLIRGPRYWLCESFHTGLITQLELIGRLQDAITTLGLKITPAAILKRLRWHQRDSNKGGQ